MDIPIKVVVHRDEDLSADRLVQLYGTVRPSRRMILSDDQLDHWLDRGIGSYVVVR